VPSYEHDHIQLSTSYTDREHHNAQHYRRTDRHQYDANSQLYCVAVRLAKK